jgi:ClpP class serine protease
LIDCRPVTPEKQALVEDLLADLHGSFQDIVRERRGSRVSAVPDAELFSGRVWTGRQAAKLGIVDEVVDMHGALVSRFGKEVSCRTLSGKKQLFIAFICSPWGPERPKSCTVPL